MPDESDFIDRKRFVIRHISTRPSASFRLLRGSETRYVAVDVPLAKLGLTKCPEARRALELQFHLIHKYELQLQTYILKYDLNPG